MAIAVLLIGAAVGWFVTRKTPGDVQASAGKPMPVEREPESRVPSFSTNPRPPHVSSSPTATQTPTVIATNTITDWEDKLDDILSSEKEDIDKAKQMLAMFRRFPEEGQVEAAQHISNLLPDQEYAPMGKLLLDPKIPEAVLDVLMVDILNRPNALKLPLLLDVARDSQHPKAGEAKDLLELYLEQDYGTDWNKWQEKLKQWMAENPD